jgi:hypothetical protein
MEHLLSWELMDNIRFYRVSDARSCRCKCDGSAEPLSGHGTGPPTGGRSPLPGSLDDHHKLACGCEQALVAFRANRTRARRCQAHGWTHLGPTARLRGPGSLLRAPLPRCHSCYVIEGSQPSQPGPSSAPLPGIRGHSEVGPAAAAPLRRRSRRSSALVTMMPRMSSACGRITSKLR